MNDYIRILGGETAGGFGWPERVLGALLAVLVLLAALAFGALILGVVAAGAVVLGARLWWWRRRLRQPPSETSMVIEGEYRVRESRRGGDREG